MQDNILAIIVLPLLAAMAVIAKCLHLISGGITWVAGLLRDKGAPVYASDAGEEILS